MAQPLLDRSEVVGHNDIDVLQTLRNTVHEDKGQFRRNASEQRRVLGRTRRVADDGTAFARGPFEAARLLVRVVARAKGQYLIPLGEALLDAAEVGSLRQGGKACKDKRELDHRQRRPIRDDGARLTFAYDPAFPL